MGERIFPGHKGADVPGEVEGRIESPAGGATLASAVADVVYERVLAGRVGIRVFLQVEGGIEEGIGIEPRGGPTEQVVQDRDSSGRTSRAGTGSRRTPAPKGATA